MIKNNLFNHLKFHLTIFSVLYPLFTFIIFFIIFSLFRLYFGFLIVHVEHKTDAQLAGEALHQAADDFLYQRVSDNISGKTLLYKPEVGLAYAAFDNFNSGGAYLLSRNPSIKGAHLVYAVKSNIYNSQIFNAKIQLDTLYNRRAAHSFPVNPLEFFPAQSQSSSPVLPEIKSVIPDAFLDPNNNSTSSVLTSWDILNNDQQRHKYVFNMMAEIANNCIKETNKHLEHYGENLSGIEYYLMIYNKIENYPYNQSWVTSSEDIRHFLNNFIHIQKNKYDLEKHPEFLELILDIATGINIRMKTISNNLNEEELKEELVSFPIIKSFIYPE